MGVDFKTLTFIPSTNDFFNGLQLIENPAHSLGLPLDIRSSVFQKHVRQALCEIPTDSTLSYAHIAEKICSPKAVRAVAGAVAESVLAIPCLQVIRSRGKLADYRWGMDRKRTLLAREAG